MCGAEQYHHQICHKRHGRKQRFQYFPPVHAAPAFRHRHGNGKRPSKAHDCIADIKHTEQGNRLRRKKAGHIRQCAEPDIIARCVDDVKRPFRRRLPPRHKQDDPNRRKIDCKPQPDCHQKGRGQLQRTEIMYNRHWQRNLQHQLAQKPAVLYRK